MNMFRRPPDRAGQASPATPSLPGLVEVMTEKDALQLASRVARAARDGGALVQLIGPQGGEGASTLARDFALTMAARSDRPVLLLDLDIPVNHQLAWAQRHGLAGGPGRALPLAGSAASEMLRLHQVAGSHLSISEQGTVPLRPELLLRSGVLAELRAQFGLVVVDSPPLGRSFDGVAVSAAMDATVVVVRAERTRAPVARDICDRLEEAGAQVAGFVFNRRRRLIPAFLYRRLG